MLSARTGERASSAARPLSDRLRASRPSLRADHDARSRRPAVALAALPRPLRKPVRPARTRLGGGAEARRASRPVDAALARARAAAARGSSTSARAPGSPRGCSPSGFPQAQIVGVDVSPAMVDEARRMRPPTLPRASSSRRPTPPSFPSRDRRLRPRRAPEHDPVLRRAGPRHRARWDGRARIVARERHSDLRSGGRAPRNGSAGSGSSTSRSWRPAPGPPSSRGAAEASGEGRNRTGDTTVFSRVLYQLSYLAAAGSVAA